jgi:hypothetical protein
MQPEATTHALPDIGCVTQSEASVYTLQVPSVLTSTQTTTVQSTNHRLDA